MRGVLSYYTCLVTRGMYCMASLSRHVIVLQACSLVGFFFFDFFVTAISLRLKECRFGCGTMVTGKDIIFWQLLLLMQNFSKHSEGVVIEIKFYKVNIALFRRKKKFNSASIN